METTHTLSYQPAWEYRRSDSWPSDIGLQWAPTPNGDQLTLSLPGHVVALTVHGLAGAEELAWMESRLGALPRTWATRPEKATPPTGSALYYLPDNKTALDTRNPLVAFRSTVKVWPSPVADGVGQWKWFDPDGVPLLGAPPFHEIYPLPAAWISAHRLPEPAFPYTRHLGGTATELLPWFLDDTLTYSGRGHFTGDRVSTEEIYQAYRDWCDMLQLRPGKRLNKIALGRYLSSVAMYERTAWRTPEGFRRGFYDVRFPVWGES